MTTAGEKKLLWGVWLVEEARWFPGGIKGAIEAFECESDADHEVAMQLMNRNGYECETRVLGTMAAEEAK